MGSMLGSIGFGGGGMFPDADRVKITDPEEKEALIKAFNKVDDEDNETLDRLGKLGYTMTEDPETGEVEFSRNKTKEEKLAEFSTAMGDLAEFDEPKVSGGIGAGFGQLGHVGTRGATPMTPVSDTPYETTKRGRTSSQYADATEKQVAGLLANPAIRNILLRGLV